MFVLYSFPYPVGRSGVGVTALERIPHLAQYGVALPLYYGPLKTTLPPSVEDHKNWVVGSGYLIHHTPDDIAALQLQFEPLATVREQYTGVCNAGLARKPPLSWAHAGEVSVGAYRRALRSDLASPRAAAA